MAVGRRTPRPVETRWVIFPRPRFEFGKKVSPPPCLLGAADFVMVVGYRICHKSQQPNDHPTFLLVNLPPASLCLAHTLTIMKSLIGIFLGPLLAATTLAGSYAMAVNNTTNSSSSSSNNSSRTTVSPQTSWPVSVSVLLTVQLDRMDRSWNEYESELMAAVDRLAVETVALMNNRWTETPTTITDEDVVDPVQVQLPMTLGISKTNNTNTNSTSSTCPTCQSVYASATLWMDPSRKDPMQVESAFEGTFHASVGHGHLQDILEGIVPDFFVTIVAHPSSTLPPGTDDDGDDDDNNFFGNPPVQINRDTPATTDVEGGLSMVGVLGVLSAALLALGISMIALWVVRQKRRSGRALDGVGHPNNNRRNKNGAPRRGLTAMRRNRRRHEVPPVNTDLDLVETFSETGLEWGTSPENADGAAPPLSNRNRTESDAQAIDTMSLEDALAPYALPTQFQMASTPDSFASTNYSTAFSMPTPDSSVGNSAMGRYSVESMATSEMKFTDVEAYHRGAAAPPTTAAPAIPSQVKMDQLEAAIMAGDWATLAKAAQENMAASDTSSVQSPMSSSRGGGTGAGGDEWSGRSRDWHGTMDGSKAALLDLLVQDGDWEGILHLAQQQQQQQNKKEFHKKVQL